MKILFSILFLTFITICSAQAKKVDIVDFYSWKASDGNKYEVMIVTEDFSETGETPATIRVRYSRSNGSQNIVEFYSTMYHEYDEDSNLIIYLMADTEASFIQGAGTYSPDNFVLSYDIDGMLISGLQADNNELDKAEDDTVYADMEAIEYGDGANMRTLIKNFYSKSDALYTDLMNYTATFD